VHLMRNVQVALFVLPPPPLACVPGCDGHTNTHAANVFRFPDSPEDLYLVEVAFAPCISVPLHFRLDAPRGEAGPAQVHTILLFCMLFLEFGFLVPLLCALAAHAHATQARVGVDCDGSSAPALSTDRPHIGDTRDTCTAGTAQVIGDTCARMSDYWYAWTGLVGLVGVGSGGLGRGHTPGLQSPE
jgi:hypothetical protein